MRKPKAIRSKTQVYGWLPREDNYIRQHFSRQPAAAIARVLTEYLASAVGDPAARRTAEDVVRRAGDLKIAGVAGMPAHVAVNVRYLNALGRAADSALQIAGNPEVQALFSLLTGASPITMALCRQLIETEVYRRRRSSNGRRG